MSETIKQLCTGASGLGAATIFNGSILLNPQTVDYITITAFTGAGLGTGLFEVNLYDAKNSNGPSFLDLIVPSGKSDNFSVGRSIRQALHGVFTGAGSLTATYR